MTIAEYAKEITDALRYTVVSSVDNLTKDYFTIVENLKKRGYTLIEVTNTFPNIDSTYRGINTLVENKNGYVFELQFHTPQSLEIKNVNHKLYEEERLASTPDDRKRKLLKMELENSNKVDAPINSEKIVNIVKEG